jgi:hypothetical protein
MISRLASFVAPIAFVASATAQTSQFEFDPSRVPVGTAMHYRKSALDGSRTTQITVYVTDRDRLESLKWDEGSEAATLVQARMDWQRFSVGKFKSWHLKRGAAPELRGTLEASADGRELQVSFAANAPVNIDRWPWHSYDFDFASLGLTLPHLRNPQADVIFWRTDVEFVGEGKTFKQIGGVRLHFESLDVRNGYQARRYSIGGAGLQHLYGKLWTDAESGLLLEYEIPIGDEPGYQDVRLRLERMEPMTSEQWQAFKKTRIGEKLSP